MQSVCLWVWSFNRHVTRPNFPNGLVLKPVIHLVDVFNSKLWIAPNTSYDEYTPISSYKVNFPLKFREEEYSTFPDIFQIKEYLSIWRVFWIVLCCSLLQNYASSTGSVNNKRTFIMINNVCYMFWLHLITLTKRIYHMTGGFGWNKTQLVGEICGFWRLRNAATALACALPTRAG